MRSDLSTQIHTHLRSYLQGQSTLEDLEHWLIFNAWDAHQTDDEHVADLVAKIQDAIVAHNNGVLMESDVRRELFEALQHDLTVTPRS